MLFWLLGGGVYAWVELSGAVAVCNVVVCMLVVCGGVHGGRVRYAIYMLHECGCVQRV